MSADRRFIACLLLPALFACAASESDGAANAGRSFTDVAAAAGIAFETPPVAGAEQILESTGSGVAVGDFDGDGDDDLYFSRRPALADHLAGSAGPPNELYRNNGDGTFTEVGEQAGVALRAWSNAAYFADIENDGDQDLFVANWGENRFFLNNGDGTFTDTTDVAGLAGPSDAWSTAAAFADLNQDGFLELFVVNYCDFDALSPPVLPFRPTWRGLDVFAGPQGLPGQPDILYRNHGDGTFSDLSDPAGLNFQSHLYGLGTVAVDLDRDQDLDFFVANDSVTNQLWQYDGGLPLAEIGTPSGTAANENLEEQGSRGVDAADYDDDGFVDLFVTNASYEWNTLYVNEGGMRFREGTFEAGLRDGHRLMGWGAKFFDYDHDGRLDLGIANGHQHPQVDDHDMVETSYAQPNQLLRNAGNGSLEAVADAAWAEEHSSRGLALIDYDMDGDVDVVLTHADASPSLLRNDVGNRRRWITVRLEGTEANRDGLGARLELEVGDRTLTRIVNPFGSFQSQSTSAVHFGLGDAEYVDKLTVYWPSLRTFVYEDLKANRFYTIREGSGIADVREPSEVSP